MGYVLAKGADYIMTLRNVNRDTQLGPASHDVPTEVDLPTAFDRFEVLRPGDVMTPRKAPAALGKRRVSTFMSERADWCAHPYSDVSPPTLR